MWWLAGVLGISVIGIIGLGLYYQLGRSAPARTPAPRLRAAVSTQLALFAALMGTTLLLGIHDAFAQAAAAAPRGEASVGFGLAILGAALPTALAAIGAGIALGAVGSSAMAVIAEKPEMFGRTLVYMGLAEGIAIYGLVISILLLNRI